MSLASLPTFLILPPANLVASALAGLLLSRGYPRVGRALCGLSLGLLLLFGLPVTGMLLIGTLQAGVSRTVPAGPPDGGKWAIVVLSADTSNAGPGGILAEPGIGAMTLERLHGGVVLARRTGLPVLVSGGIPKQGVPSLASQMARVMAEDFGLAATFVEPRSDDTWQNATYSADILRAAGFSGAMVVTNAWHMKRALLAFERAGFPAIGVPSRFDPPPQWEAAEFLPRVSAWLRSYFAVHEWVGYLWYRMRR